MQKMASEKEMALELQVSTCLGKIREIFDQEKSASFVGVNQARHTYEDKYTLTEQLTNCTVAAVFNAFYFLGLTPEVMLKAKTWAANSSLSLCIKIDETCVFIQEIVREIESQPLVEAKMETEAFKQSTKVITKTTEYLYKYRCNYRILLIRGCESSQEDVMEIKKNVFEQDCVVRAKKFPFPENRSENLKCNITWFINRISPDSCASSFAIDRSHAKCFTPTRNPCVEEALREVVALRRIAGGVLTFANKLLEVAESFGEGGGHAVRTKDKEGLFVPICTVFHAQSRQSDASDNSDGKEDKKVTFFRTSPPHSSDTPDTNDSRITLTSQELDVLLSAQWHSIAHKITTLSSSHRHAEIVTLAILMLHIADLCTHYEQSLDLVEHVLRSQVISAIGRELTPLDFETYMTGYHYRRMVRECYHPLPFALCIRRTVSHSIEGMVRIETQHSTQGGYYPIHTFTRTIPYTHSSGSSDTDNGGMEVALNVSTKIRFRGPRYVHGYLGHTFSTTTSSMPSMRLVCSAKAFSSYIVLLGRIVSDNMFDPIHAFVLHNKEDMVIPLWLESIPTAKQFKHAVDSLSPEQQRFCKAYRSMQLESTLFGIVIVQIKPRLEKVLNLTRDSLTKEIKLTQDVMKLFMEYQISSDLLAFDEKNYVKDGGEVTAMERVEVVRDNVKVMVDMIAEMKRREVEEEKQRQVLLEKQREVERLQREAEEAAEAERRRWEEEALEGGMDMFGGGGYYEDCYYEEIDCLDGGGCDFFSGDGCAEEEYDDDEEEGDYDEDSCDDSPNQEDDNNKEDYSNEDVTLLPRRLDALLERHDYEDALRPTIIHIGDTWTKTSCQRTLTSGNTSRMTISGEGLVRERSAAFDLLDALTRSGAMVVEDAQLHVIVAATHSFDRTLMDCVVCDNKNPIEAVERSALLVLAALHNVDVGDVEQKMLIGCRQVIEA